MLTNLKTPHSYPGRLFVVEGIDGSGKTTQLGLLAKWLTATGHRVYVTEWNSSVLVKAATKQGKKNNTLTPMTFSLLHATDFADRLLYRIIPPLQAGMDMGLSTNLNESFRLFQSRVLEEYDHLVDEFGLGVVDARGSITEQQRIFRRMVTECLESSRVSTAAAAV